MGSFFFRNQFRTVDGSAGSFLIQEVDDCCPQRQVFVYVPVDSSERFPAAVEVERFLKIGVRLAEIAETKLEA